MTKNRHNPARNRRLKRGKDKPVPKAYRAQCRYCQHVQEIWVEPKKKPKPYVCDECGVGQKPERTLTANYTEGNNATGHRVAW